MDPVIELYRNDSQTVIDAFDRIVVHIFMQKEKKQHKFFVICGCNPGAGTTSTAVELAISLAVAGWKTVLVDADLRKENQYKRLNQKVKAGLSDYIVDKELGTSICCATNWPGLDYIACGRNRDETPVKMLCSVRMGELMEELRQKYDFVIFDVPSLNSAVDAKILASKADCTFLVVESGVTTFKNLSSAKKQMDEAGANVAGVIENKLPMEEYRKVVKDYNYFNAKEFVGRKRSAEKRTRERNTERSKKVSGFFRKIMGCLVLSVLLTGHFYSGQAYASSGTVTEISSGYGQASSYGSLPLVMVSGYEIAEGEAAAGKDFTLELYVKNENRYTAAHHVAMTVYSQTEGVYLQPGETNQRYAEYISPGGTGSFQIHMTVAEHVESTEAIIEVRFDYVNENGTPGTNTTSISPTLQDNAKLDVVSLTAANYVNLGARALLNIQYANTGEAEVRNVRMRIEGNIEEEQKHVNVEAPEIGQQKYLDWYVIFTEAGNQRLSVSLTYEDERGILYEMDPEYVSVIVTPDAETTNAVGTPSEPEDSRAEISVSSGFSFSNTEKKILAAAGCAVLALLVAGIWLGRSKGLCLISLRARRKKKGGKDGASENR